MLRILGRSSAFLLDSHITETDKNIVKDNLKDEQLYFVSYKLDANNSGSRSRIRLSYNNRVLVGETSQKGPIDSILRSIEQALNEEMDFRNVSVHHRVSDTTTEKSTIRVSIRVYKTSPGSENILPGYIEATDESEDLLFSTARAYVKALNTMLRRLREKAA